MTNSELIHTLEQYMEEADYLYNSWELISLIDTLEDVLIKLKRAQRDRSRND